VRGLVQIVNNNGTGFKRHDGNLPYSPFVRLLICANVRRRARDPQKARMTSISS
jgi:hypothetical protein